MRKDNDRKAFANLIEIRGACQYLQARMGEPTTKVDDALLHEFDLKIKPALHRLRDIFSSDCEEGEWAADYLVHIELAWTHVMKLAPSTQTPPDQTAEMLKQMTTTLDDIIYQCCSLTLAPRVNDVLPNLSVGQVLDVEFEMGKDLPKDPTLRKRLIDELAQESRVIEGGLVDSEAGVIYKADPNRRKQRRSVAWLALLLCSGIALPFLLAAGKYVVGTSWPIPASRLNELIVAYVVVLIGSGIHLALDALKKARAQKRPDFHDTHDWVLWVHVRFWRLLYSIVWIMAGYVCLAFGVASLDWQTALFAGYSIDSITDLFIGRFQTLAAAKVKTITGATTP